MRWFEPKELDIWAASAADAPTLFPTLLRRLIAATIHRADLIDLPGGTSVYLSGWDGRVHTRRGTRFVPEGDSGWELGTGARIREKANGDFKKRTKDPWGMTPSEATFVFATPRRWARKKTWCDEKQAQEEKGWKDVRVIDATNLADWLEEAPAVGLWFAKKIGVVPERDARSLEDFWSDWREATQPPLGASLLTARRAEVVDRLSSWADGDPSPLVLRAETRDEALAFVAAALAEPEGEFGHTVRSRGVVVSTQDAFRDLAQSRSPLFLLVDAREEAAWQSAVKRGHHVLVAADQGDAATPGEVILDRVKREEAVSALVEMGLSEPRARRLLRRSSRSIPVLRRLLPTPAGMGKPTWSTPPRRELLPALLLGSWEENTAGDQSCLESLMGKPAHEVYGDLVAYLGTPDAPIRRVEPVWRAVSHYELWERLGTLLTNGDMDRFAEVARRVLGAPTRDEAPAHIRAFRRGVATTLALMGSRPDCAPHCTDVEGRARVIVRELLRGASSERWATLGAVIPALAEAAPCAFLEAVKKALGADPSPFAEILSLVRTVPSVPSYYTELVWALRRVAWSREHFSAAVTTLAGIADLDLDDSGPFERLRECFEPGIRVSEASDRARLNTLKRLLGRHPRVAWRVLLSIFSSRSVLLLDGGVPEPEWRSWGEAVRAPTPKEGLQYLGELTQLAIEQAADDAERWVELVPCLRGFPRDRLEWAISELEVRKTALSAHGARLALWNALRDVVHSHRSHPDAHWAMTSEHVDRLVGVYEAIAPTDPLERHGWLFQRPQLLEGDSGDFAADRERIRAMQRAAVADIFSTGGSDGLTSFVQSTEQSSAVSGAVVEAVTEASARVELILRWLPAEDGALLQCAKALCGAQCARGGLGRIDEIVERAKGDGLSHQQIAQIFYPLASSHAVWDRLEREPRAVGDAYWGRSSSSFGLGRDDPSLVERAVHSLLAHGNAIAAAELLFLSAADPDAGLYILVLRQLPAALAGVDLRNRQPPLPDLVDELFKGLDRSGGERRVIAKLELPLLDVLRRTRRKLALHWKIAADPVFFCQLVTWTRRSSGDTVGENERGGRALAALRGCELLPGPREDGAVDSDALKSWVEEARRLCEEEGLRDPGDEFIGHLLANAPRGRDDIWPCEEVRDVLEEVGTLKIGLGFLLGENRRRGVTTRGSSEGGEQEWELAQTYERYADGLEDSHPFVIKWLRKLARGYGREGEWFDTRAELRDLGE